MVAKVNPRFYDPVRSISPLEAVIHGVIQMEKLRYTIEQRLPGGAWNHKSDYGSDEAHALRNARWFRQILRGKVDYRVCACVGEAKAVILGEVSP
ncbi:hypothetical protein BW38_00267 [Stenotrophomonas sp. RIT309]|uniref:hypothetical protein n=1 Tax=Stenotrophomonas sp. RIT309 TaxID=1470590 RepID=UPI0004494336|nr:hypothetical protein [Stenotrophomonas sp. RIT309]EZP47886.1 hypothetical protein BW38_00267 [Stenotrophomonas sp. RIT309]